MRILILVQMPSKTICSPFSAQLFKTLAIYGKIFSLHQIETQFPMDIFSLLDLNFIRLFRLFHEAKNTIVT